MGRTYRHLKSKDRKKLKDLRRKRKEYRHAYGDEGSSGSTNKGKNDG